MREPIGIFCQQFNSRTSKTLALLAIFFCTGCTTPLERSELSKVALEQRFSPSDNRIDFPCSFGFQSSMLEYQNSMVQGQWWVGSCIIDLTKNSLYFGAPSPSDPKNPSKISIYSVELKEYGSFSIINRNQSLVSQALSTPSAYPSRQLVLATRARLPRPGGAGNYSEHPKQRVIMNFPSSANEQLNVFFQNFGLKALTAHKEVRLVTQEEPVFNPYEFVPLRKM
jgi:hypothetical protein